MAMEGKTLRNRRVLSREWKDTKRYVLIVKVVLDVKSAIDRLLIGVESNVVNCTARTYQAESSTADARPTARYRFTCLHSSVIFVLIYFLVLVLVFELFFSFSFVLVLQYFFILILVLPVIFWF